jgi:phosphomannomutase/phosphoglucomutase
LIEGLRSSGIEVTSAGLMPGPACYFNTFNKFDFGVFVTASHLPPEYNGFKIIMRDGSSIDPKDLLKVKELFLNFKFNKPSPKPVKQDITALNDYHSFLRQEFGRLGVKCVIDCFNACTGLSSNLFEELLDARVINSEALPDFGGRHPEPSEKNLKEVQDLVIKSKASFGVGLDGDGDRSVFIDEGGVVIDGNKMTMLFAKNVLEHNKGGVIVAPVSVSNLLESKVVKPLGGEVVWCPVGHTFIEKELIKHDGVFGGEFSSHFYWNEFYPFSDGVLSTLMLARIIKESGKKLSELVGELPQVFVVKEESEFKSHSDKEKVANLLVKNMLVKHPEALTMDGIKFVDGDVSVLLRQSQTRHTVKVFIEAEDKVLANKKLDEYFQLIESHR